MAATIAPPSVALPSYEATWDRARLEMLPADGNRCEVIDGCLYLSTSPSPFDQWTIRAVVAILLGRLDHLGMATTWLAPVGVFMPGCDPVQPVIAVACASGAQVYQPGRIACYGTGRVWHTV